MRTQAALLKQEIEAKLAHRIPAALSPIAQQAPRLQPIGIRQLDNSLGGGLPLGSICELTGPDGSGRSSIAVSLLSSASIEGVCAYIDVSDTMSPQSAAAVGSGPCQSALGTFCSVRETEEDSISVHSELANVR